MEDKMRSPQGGFLRIYQNGKLLRNLLMEGSNIILDNYRRTMARLAMQENGTEEVNGTVGVDNTPRRYYYTYNEDVNTAADAVIPYALALDNKGAYLNGDYPDTLDTEGTWEVKTPSINDFVDPDDYEIDPRYTEKEIDLADNIVTCYFNVADESIDSDRIFTRATLVSRDGQPLATKCFKGVRKGDAGLDFEWSVAY